MERCLSDLINAGFNVKKYESLTQQQQDFENQPQELHNKEIICVFDNTLSEEVLEKMAENDQIF